MSEREYNGGPIPADRLSWERDEPEAIYLKVGGVDLTPYVVGLNHHSPAAAEEFADTYAQQLAGLKQSSFTFTGLWGPVLPPVVSAPAQLHVPDGRWQLLKHRLKFRLPRLLRWLKVRYVIYDMPELSHRFVDDPAAAQEFIEARTTGPITRRVEER